MKIRNLFKKQDNPNNVQNNVIFSQEFQQSSAFRGFRRFQLTIYEEPGVNEGIEHFRKSPTEFEITKGTPIKLEIKDFSHYGYKKLYVYLDNQPVGVLYDSNTQFQDIFSRPFDKLHIRIEQTHNIITSEGIEVRPAVYLFVHFVDV